MPSTRDQRPYNVGYYARNREAEIRRVQRRQWATVDWLRELRRVPCMDCGGTFPPHVMQFDHRDPKIKLFSLAAQNVFLKNRAMLQAEVAKCDVVCANCHRIRTERQRVAGYLPFGFKPVAHPKPGAAAARHREAWRVRKRAQIDVVNRIRQLPCMDCGRTYPICVMEFDHRPGRRKLGLVSQMVGRVSIAKLLEEIAKCDMVCSNCHRDRTFRQWHSRGCVVVAANGASNAEVRVRFPPPAPEQGRLIEESPARYLARRLTASGTQVLLHRAGTPSISVTLPSRSRWRRCARVSPRAKRSSCAFRSTGNSGRHTA